MSILNANDAAAPRQVACETADNDQIPVDHDLMRLSGTFKDMCDDLGLEEHGVFEGVFPVKTVSSRIFEKVVIWCKEHKDDPEPVIEKDPLTQECKWFALTESERLFFDVPMSELFELIMAANYLDIKGLYHYACQSVAARIQRRSLRVICKELRQNFDLDDAQIRKILDDNPWLDQPDALPGALVKNAIFIPNEVLVTIFEKLPRKELERLQLVSTQFEDVIVSSSELSESQGPLRVVKKVEFGTRSYGAHGIDVWLRDGARVTCSDYEDLAKRLKFAAVLKLRVPYWCCADIQGLSALLPVKSAWENATLEASVQCFTTKAQFEFAFTHLLLCKEVILEGGGQSFMWSLPFMRLPAIEACSKLDISGLSGEGIRPTDVAEWLDYEDPTGKKWSEPRQIVLHERGIIGGIDGLLTVLKTTFSASDRPNPYFVRLNRWLHRGSMNEAISNEQTHERLNIRAGQTGDVIVERA